MINYNQNSLKIYEDTILYLLTSYENFDFSKLKITYGEDIVSTENSKEDFSEKNFKLFYNYSLDKINYSEFVETLVIPNDIINQNIYISILIKKKIIDDTHKPLTLRQTQNVNEVQRYLEIESIKYNDIALDLTNEDIIKFETIYQVINKYPKFNFYDNQTINIKRWKDTLFATSGIGSFICIYFRTNPIKTETVETFRNHVLRNVVAVKKLLIQNSDGEFPADKQQVSEWDMALLDDYIIHINAERFEIAFGANQVPHQSDYLYIPLINKLFQVNQSNPVRGFIGQIGWWEAYLGKWEDNESITFAEGLKESLEDVPEFDESFNAMNEIELDDTLKSEIFNELNTIKANTLDTNEKNLQKTIEEKKSATQNYTNKLVDSNNYISLKETEKLREYYERRLSLITVNPDTSAFPLVMYDNTTVDKNVVAMQYNLTDFVETNNFSLNVNIGLNLSFNYVLINKFNGNIIDLMQSDLSIFQLIQNRDCKIVINNVLNTEQFVVDYVFDLLEFYNIEFNYSKSIKQFAIKIFKLVNEEKNLEYQNIYNFNEGLLFEKITHCQLFGGKFYSNELTLTIDNNQILKDYTKPLLMMNNG